MRRMTERHFRLWNHFSLSVMAACCRKERRGEIEKQLSSESSTITDSPSISHNEEHISFASKSVPTIHIVFVNVMLYSSKLIHNCVMSRVWFRFHSIYRINDFPDKWNNRWRINNTWSIKRVFTNKQESGVWSEPILFTTQQTFCYTH